MLNPVYEFLSQYKMEKDDSGKYPQPITHQCYGSFGGCFHLDKLARKELLTVYTREINKGAQLCILERQKEYSCILIDVDIKVTNFDDPLSRLYNDKTIKDVIKMYKSVLSKIVKKYNVDDNDDDNFIFMVTEKAKPSIKKLNSDLEEKKDGFHIIMPNTCFNKETREYIYDQVIKMANERDIFNGLKADEIIDKAVVSSNGWLLYGSSKPGCLPYILTKIYNMNGKLIYDHKLGKSYDPKTGEEYDELYTNEKIIKYCSIQSDLIREKYATPLKENIKINHVPVNNAPINSNIISTVKKNINELGEYIECLSKERYNYNNWIQVAFALHSAIDEYNSDELLDLFNSWSSKDNVPGRYKGLANIMATWRSIKTMTTGGTTLKSFYKWCQEDNSKLFNKLVSKYNGNNDEAKEFIKIFGGENEIEKSKYINKILGNRLKVHIDKEKEENKPKYYLYNNDTKLYEKLKQEKLTKHIIDLLINKISTFIETDELNKIKNKLTKYVYYKDIINNISTDNEHNDFIKMLNLGKDKYLPIKNGKKINLETLEVIDRNENDYYDFELNVNYTKNDRTFEENFLRKLMNDNEEKYNYLKQVLGYSITGLTSAQSFFVFYGSGSNGKSTLFNILDEVMGNFYNQGSSDIFVKKNKSASSASPELEILKKSRLVCFSESDQNDKFNNALIKQISGEDKIVFRMLFNNNFEKFKSPTKLIMSTNSIPDFDPNDEAFIRRFKYIHFNMKFSQNQDSNNKCDVDIKTKINNDNFFSILCEEASKYINSDNKSLVLPGVVKDEFNLMLFDKDLTKQFIRDMITKTDNKEDTISFSNLYISYKQYCADNNKNNEGRNKFYDNIKKNISPNYYRGDSTKHPYKLIYYKFKNDDNINDDYELDI
jgi:P4 family phage/plasmid primase-like protien